GYTPVLSLMLAGYLMHWLPEAWTTHSRHAVMRMPLVVQAVLLIAVIYLIIQVKSSDIQPFIYFQF
ncbi:MAG: MBOAT family protein, partial [Bacteroidaceae bacterium]|nr:MBOAT family protein [Bacteroidaceae bacterium]